MTPAAKTAIEALDRWYNALKTYQDHLPSKGSIAAAIHVLERLTLDFNLNVNSHVAEGEAQITGLSPRSVQKVLGKFGETRALSSVGGRSNRGARGDVAALLAALVPLHLESRSVTDRNATIESMQKHIVTAYVSRYFDLKRVKAEFDPTLATWRLIDIVLSNARENGKAGAVAEYLVGAKLALRFPGKKVRNKQFSTSDAQGGFAGDFPIGTTVFHVTMSPMPELFEKLKANIKEGHRIYLLVPRAALAGAQQNAEGIAGGRIAVESIESFVATNVDELAEFDGAQLKSGVRRLLETYNQRVAEVELDKSLLIEIPPNLQ